MDARSPTFPTPALMSKMSNYSFKGVNLYLHVVHEDLSCHAHLQHPMHYQLAVGSEQVSTFVQVLQPLHFRVFTD